MDPEMNALSLLIALQSDPNNVALRTTIQRYNDIPVRKKPLSSGLKFDTARLLIEIQSEFLQSPFAAGTISPTRASECLHCCYVPAVN